MISTFICHHCGLRCRCNPRVKNQKYCSAKACQQARKNTWGKTEYQTNETHRQNRLLSQKRCYQDRKGDVYMHKYREDHIDYRVRNRELQKIRNRKRKKDESSKIVNTDALSLQPSIDGVYALMQVTTEGKIVNTDAFMVQLQAVADLQMFSASNTG